MEVNVYESYLYSDEFGYGTSLITIVCRFDETPTITELKMAIKTRDIELKEKHIVFTPTDYDCSGQLFTTGMRKAGHHIHGENVIFLTYHDTAVDI